MNTTLAKHLMAKHAKAQKALASIKDQEMKMRKKVEELLFPQGKIGTNKMDFTEDAFTVKCVRKEGIKADVAGLQDVLDGIPAENKTGLVTWSVSMSLSKYKSLPMEYKDMLAGNVTIKPESPTVEYDGEVPTFSAFDTMHTRNGMVYISESPLEPLNADRYAIEFGMSCAEDLVRFLEEIQ